MEAVAGNGPACHRCGRVPDAAPGRCRGLRPGHQYSTAECVLLSAAWCEPRRISRRPFGLSYAAMATASIWAYLWISAHHSPTRILFDEMLEHADRRPNPTSIPKLQESNDQIAAGGSVKSRWLRAPIWTCVAGDSRPGRSLARWYKQVVQSCSTTVAKPLESFG